MDRGEVVSWSPLDILTWTMLGMGALTEVPCAFKFQ